MATARASITKSRTTPLSLWSSASYRLSFSLLEASDFEVTEPPVCEDRRFFRIVRADLSGDPAECGAVRLPNVAVPESVAADDAGLVSVAYVAGAQGIAAASYVTAFSAIPFVASRLPLSEGAPRPHPLPCRCRRPFGCGVSGGTPCAASSISGVLAALFFAPFHRRDSAAVRLWCRCRG